jgi:hypothetical protein
MKISVKRLKQIIKEELENIAEYERDHPEGKCAHVHAGMDHEEWTEGERSLMSEGDDDDIDEEECIKKCKERHPIRTRRQQCIEICKAGTEFSTGLQNEEYSITDEDLEDILEEDEWGFLEEEDLYEG